MWTTRRAPLLDHDGFRLTIDLDARPATVAELAAAWQADAGFRELFNASLADAPFHAFRWETPGVTLDTATRAFECVLLNDADLDRKPDPQPFAQHLARASGQVATFANLGGDAILVAPRQLAAPSAYGHLAAFVRQAPPAQGHALWQAVGGALTQRLGQQPVWLSTAGAGVAWLHVRLDNRPKYYGYAPFKHC